MKRLAWAVAMLMSASFLFAADANSRYFTNVRSIEVAQPSGTNYIAIDPEIWLHAQPDLGDLRIYNGSQGIPYALRTEGSVEYTEQKPVKVLNKGIVPDATQFLLDMSGVDVYDQITLELSQKDFDRIATVEGANTPDATTWAKLTSAPVFDFTRQHLGTNFTVKLPPSNFRYLKVSISGKGVDHGNDILPDQVTGATACNTFRASAIWDGIPSSPPNASVNGNESIIRFALPKSVPIDRIHFAVPEDRVNFRREVTIEILDDDPQHRSKGDVWLPVASGSISRVRSAKQIHENLDIPTHDTRGEQWRITIHNGDDPPLPLQFTAQSLQRRVYFDPNGASTLQLYYGDPKVNSPVYDYDKFFREDNERTASQATLGLGLANPGYTARPDERPWSERNPWVLWTAMAVAILGIGAIALRGLRKA